MKAVFLLLLLISSAAGAQIRPAATGSDPMQHAVNYADGQTVILETAPGFQLTVEFGQGERILTAAAGNSSAWQVSAPGQSSSLFVRPLEGAPVTNLTVVTNRHSYSFLLVASARMESTNALRVRFIYPEVAVADPGIVAIPSSLARTSYRLSGAKEVRPSSVWDDGAKTYLEWPAGVELPAVFAMDGRRGEALVNAYVRDGRLVIDAVYSQLIFRLDSLTASARRQTGRT